MNKTTIKAKPKPKLKPALMAYPTVFSGFTFRSRFEARVAQLLSRLGMKYQYERESFLLPGGICYLPDFVVPTLNLYVEARGYATKKGNDQIAQFVEVMPQDAIYVVLRDDRFGGCRCWHGGKWEHLGLRLPSGGYTCSVRVLRSEIEMQYLGHWLSLSDLEEGLAASGETAVGARFVQRIGAGRV